MKKAQREVYRELGNVMEAQLCIFCKFGRGYCDHTECNHYLDDRFNHYGYELGPGEDCWGFMPCMPVAEVADVAGIVLSSGIHDWAFTRVKGELRVYNMSITG